ncbi:MAG TPA: ankyrin repeat domain-containing protein [bacterium]|nr:ankyrin repeat domain-containing protein [bacterium]
MNKYLPIIKDALILMAFSSIFAVLSIYAADWLKGSGVKTDPIIAAIIQNDIDQIKKLIEAEGGRVNNLDEQGRTPLMWAAYVNYKSGELVAKDEVKRLEATTILLEKNADKDLKDKDGWTALMWAAWSGFPKVSEALTGAGADIAAADKKGNTALMIAALRGNASVVKHLIEKGADKTLKNTDGKTAADMAQEMSGKYPDKMSAYNEILSLVK